MANATLGAIIISIATGALMIAVELAEKSFKESGKYSLTSSEINILNQAGLNTSLNVNALEQDLSILYK